MSGRCRVTRGPSRGTARRIIHTTRGGMGGERRSARLAHLQLASCPGSCGSDGLPRAIVVRTLLLKESEHTHGAIGGPNGQGFSVLPTKFLSAFS